MYAGGQCPPYFLRSMIVGIAHPTGSILATLHQSPAMINVVPGQVEILSTIKKTTL